MLLPDFVSPLPSNRSLRAATRVTSRVSSAQSTSARRVASHAVGSTNASAARSNSVASNALASRRRSFSAACLMLCSTRCTSAATSLRSGVRDREISAAYSRTSGSAAMHVPADCRTSPTSQLTTCRWSTSPAAYCAWSSRPQNAHRRVAFASSSSMAAVSACSANCVNCRVHASCGPVVRTAHSARLSATSSAAKPSSSRSPRSVLGAAAMLLSGTCGFASAVSHASAVASVRPLRRTLAVENVCVRPNCRCAAAAAIACNPCSARASLSRALTTACAELYSSVTRAVSTRPYRIVRSFSCPAIATCRPAWKSA
ncbi:hypothetical protein COEREDRAFT_83301 [Coemansia reversa NRRL 1564]|uniref:Uncharacterized protein n=1 Tax=Coemansia reversa (strain ATCC 12441 / NRRL 1564) TaxID=763665 RepID=A0A2G5B3V1_COERN|nr:hypothetical protein COEREDRAFT_83301 [Coemansia reversa NRRL 1564]|eukprot:PIA13703.1 hypothetical protein COEREDRAFT_83301 [Coemansia reversa NRRL 1564]